MRLLPHNQFLEIMHCMRLSYRSTDQHISFTDAFTDSRTCSKQPAPSELLPVKFLSGSSLGASKLSARCSQLGNS
jgi:hypothetical protein